MCNSMKQKDKFLSIQCLRGLAALSVVLFHYRFYIRGATDEGVSIGNYLFSWGVIGVDVFFIMSGFIMFITTQHYRAEISSAKRFLYNRAVRILPMYFSGLLIAFVLAGGVGYFDNQDKIKDLISSISFTAYNVNIKPHYINDDSFYNVRWTLNYELYFYLVFSLCLLFRKRILAVLSWCFIAIAIIPSLNGFDTSLSTQGYSFNSAMAGLMTNPMIIEFVFGVIVGSAYNKLRNSVTSRTFQWLYVSLSAVTLSLIVTGMKYGYIHEFDIKSSLLLAIFILSLLLSEPTVSKLIPNVFVKLGDISFSLYLLHNPIGIAIFTACGLYGDTFMNGYPAILLAIGVSIIASLLTYNLIELRFSTLLKKRAVGSKNPQPLSGSEIK